jgi:hypothetical protein
MSDKPITTTLLVTTGPKQVVINSNIAFTVKESEGIHTIHVSDLIQALVLNEMKNQEKAVLVPGKYRLTLTAAISDVTEDSNVIPFPNVSQEEDEVPTTKSA